MPVTDRAPVWVMLLADDTIKLPPTVAPANAIAPSAFRFTLPVDDTKTLPLKAFT